MAAAVAGGVLVAVLFAAVSTSEPVPMFERWPSISLGDVEPELLEIEVGSQPGADEEPDVFLLWEIDLPSWLDVILQVLLLAAGIALAIVAWQRRPRLQWRRRRVADDIELLDDLPDLVDAMAADEASQRSALAQGSPRNAIVACWLRLEAAAAAAGVEPRPSDTAEEATTRILAERSVDPEAALRLAALYREARFSSHVMEEEARDAAIACLDAIHDGLRREASSPA